MDARAGKSQNSHRCPGKSSSPQKTTAARQVFLILQTANECMGPAVGSREARVVCSCTPLRDEKRTYFEQNSSLAEQGQYKRKGRSRILERATRQNISGPYVSTAHKDNARGNFNIWKFEKISILLVPSKCLLFRDWLNKQQNILTMNFDVVVQRSEEYLYLQLWRDLQDMQLTKKKKKKYKPD